MTSIRSCAFVAPLCAPCSLTARSTAVRFSHHHRVSVPRHRVFVARLNPPDDRDLIPQSLPQHVDHAFSTDVYCKPEFAPESAVGGGNIGTIDGGSGAGGGDGESGDASNDDDPQSLQSALRDSGRTLDDLSQYARALPVPGLLSYVNATSSPLSAFLANNWQGWARRCAADPEFPFKVLMELTVGLALSSSGMIGARGKNIFKELDFAVCDIAVGAAVNFVLVYLLAPVLLPASVKPSVFAKLPANMFIAGNHSLPARIATLGYKGALFAVCGFAASVFGTTVSQGLIAVRSAVSPSSKPNKQLPNLLANSIGWAGFMALSANPRYQMVAGVERALFSFAPETVAKVGSAFLRTGNNVVGGANWVWWARFIGLQPKPVVDPVTPLPADPPSL